jgi:hypothetical protein
MTDRPDLVRALGPLTGAVLLVRYAVASGELRVRGGRIVSPDAPRTPLVQLTRADGTTVRPARPHAAAQCDLCNESLDADHAHLVDVAARSLQCVCRACALLFASEGAGAGQRRVVPDRYEPLGELDHVWSAVDLPVNLAFFMRHSGTEHVAIFYPSPAGATESLLPMDSWQDWTEREPRLATVEPDTEALLIRRHRDRREAFVVPVDACYELVGIIRRHWRGFDGGAEARASIEQFFDRVRTRSGSFQESTAHA